MLTQSDQGSNGQRLLKQLRDEYKKTPPKAMRNPEKNIPPARASFQDKSRPLKSRHQ